MTKRNHRLAVSGLFSFAKTRGWVKENPVTDSARPKPPKTRPGILRPAEVVRLLAALQEHAPALVPFWSVRLFAGIREQEVFRMDWSMIDLKAGDAEREAAGEDIRPFPVPMPANAALL